MIPHQLQFHLFPPQFIPLVYKSVFHEHILKVDHHVVRINSFNDFIIKHNLIFRILCALVASYYIHKKLLDVPMKSWSHISLQIKREQGTIYTAVTLERPQLI